ncbi:MAG TPA: S41 family peptidase, partial [Vicinamibacteria bacterium]
MATGAVTADFDAVEIEAKSGAGEWTPIPIRDPGFEEAPSEKGGGWYRTGTVTASVSRPSEAAPQGARYLRIAPPGAAVADVELFPEGAPAAGAHADIDLGSGLRARVPLALTDAQARPDPARRARLLALHAAIATVRGPSATPDVDQRLADVVVAWSVSRHFYPYRMEAGVDWDTRLAPNLDAARLAATRAAQREALLALVADARDGHGFVADTLDRSERGELPVRLAVLDGRLVVVSTAVPAEVPVGAVVRTMDGVPAADRLARETALASGSPQWQRVKALWPLTSGPRGATVRLGIDDGSGSREVTLGCGVPPPPAQRPDSALRDGAGPVVRGPHAGEDVGGGAEARRPREGGGDRLRRARLPDRRRIRHPAPPPRRARGRPLDARGEDRRSVLRDGRLARPRLGPEAGEPEARGERRLLTDGGAISYAESVMGYVADRKLGTIVGGTTAGTNGNVASFLTPGGFNVGFTGMLVTRHDGRSPHHLVGVRPDAPVEPTIAGLRKGRDEVLEQGLAIARTSAPGDG